MTCLPFSSHSPRSRARAQETAGDMLLESPAKLLLSERPPVWAEYVFQMSHTWTKSSSPTSCRRAIWSSSRHFIVLSSKMPQPGAQPASSLPSCSSPKISCCSTILYTLALSSVNTVVVFRSRPRNASRISAEGFAASSARTPESCITVNSLCH